MRVIKLLIAGLLCLVLSAQLAVAQDLQQKVSLKVGKSSLPDVLQQIQKKYGVRFSYLNNELAADTISNFEVQEKPLSEVLDQLLKNGKAGYRSYNGQIIIKKSFLKESKSSKEDESQEEEPVQSSSPDKKENSAAEIPLTLQSKAENSGAADIAVLEAEEVKTVQAEMAVDSLIEAEPTTANMVQPEPSDQHFQEENKAVSADATMGSTIVKEEKDDLPSAEVKGSNPKRNSNQLGGEVIVTKVKEVVEVVKSSLKNDSIPEEDSLNIKPFHVGIIYPLSNHGTRSTQYINRFSAHLLVGVSGGLRGLEFSSVGNIEKHKVKGLQFAGVFNIVGEEVQGAQFAGTLNAAGGSLDGFQFAGALNVSGDSVDGGQFAGFGNFSAGATRGIQSAGFMNISGANLTGLQTAGFLNIADSVNGAQFAGFLNTASHVKGIQAAGFLNKARYVQGVQLGVINIADSVSGGVPIGVLSIVKNGYRALEVYAGDDFDANLNFKIGVRQFYNILALGVELNGNKRTGYGYGFGSELLLTNRLHLNIDAISYYVNESSYTNFPEGIFDHHSVNNLNKLRLLASLQLGRNIALFGGPTYNVFVSRYQASPEGPLGSGLVENVFFDRTNRFTNVKMWIGFNAGIRF